MPVAVGTSLLVIAMKSFAGLAGYLASVEIDWPVALAVTAAAVVGSLVGSRLTGVIAPDVLRRGFGWFVVVMGLFVLAQQVPADVMADLAASLWFWVVIALVSIGAVALLWRRRRRATAAGSASALVEEPTPDEGLLDLDGHGHHQR